jgi:hypothetical protein
MEKKDIEYFKTIHKEGYQNFAKMIGIVSSVSLGFVVNLYKEISGTYSLWLLHASLIFFALSVIFMLIAFLTSAKSAEYYYLNKEKLGGKSAKRTQWLNNSVLILTIFGVILLAISVIINYY